MTTAHRPTFEPARGGMGRNEGDLSKLSQQYSARDMPSHTKLKYRNGVQISDDSITGHRRTLEDRESRGTGKERSSRPSLGALPPSKRSRHDDSGDDEAANPDDDDPADAAPAQDSDASDDESDDEAALMAELAAIKKERQAERAEKEAREKAEMERIRSEDLLHANPLLQSTTSNFSVKRRWDDDVVFKNCAKGIDLKKQPSFINDSIRTEFHRKFMEKYIK